MTGLFELMDEMAAAILEVDVETYIETIEHKCSPEDGEFISFSLFSENPEKIKEATNLFKSYLDE